MATMHVRLDEEKDKDIIEFWKMQSNKTLTIKIILRKLIKQFGYKDIVRLIDLSDIK